MIRIIKQRLFIILGTLMEFAQRTYWFIWRGYQLTQFKKIGENVFIGRNSTLTYKNISIGNNVYIGNNACFQSMHGEIVIGNHIMFGPNVQIHGGNHSYKQIGIYMKDIDDKVTGEDGSVVICDDVWIGAGSIILKGVTIGEGSIVGAGSIINSDVKPYSIVVGAKSRKEFERFDEETIQKHKELLKQNGIEYL